MSVILLPGLLGLLQPPPLSHVIGPWESCAVQPRFTRCLRVCAVAERYDGVRDVSVCVLNDRRGGWGGARDAGIPFFKF